MRQKHKICKFLVFVFVAIFIGYCAGSIAFLVRFPSEIRLTEFASHKLTIGLPLRTTFHSETAAVAKVNNVPVTENFSIRARRPLIIQTDSTGTAEMTVAAFGVPIRRITLDVVPDIKVIPLGTAIGVRINTDGVMVLGMGSFLGEDGNVHRPSDGILRAGDLLFKANGTKITSKEALSTIVAKSEGDVKIFLRREGNEVEVTLSPATAATDGIRRIGAWVRDSTKGIGTLTYFNPRTGTFGALGHGIMDVDTKKLMSVKSGIIMPSTVTSVKRGLRGAPGELEGVVDTSRVLGQISSNNPSGIYGKLDKAAKAEIITREPIPIALRTHIKEGSATILTSVSGKNVKEYEIYIENVNRFTTDETKGMVIRITDPELLQITGGIVQGMSGSPILQNGRLIGAITHVFVQDPTKGYGIFIENMIQPENHSPCFRFTEL
ncbi:MAG: SpoIVB peptidase [Firmicutes bacterium]|nr:SpoIVB peptidase [Bacillota bacterium]